MSIGLISVSQCPSIYQRDSWHLLISINQLLSWTAICTDQFECFQKSWNVSPESIVTCPFLSVYFPTDILHLQLFKHKISLAISPRFLLRVCLIPTGLLHKVLMVLNFVSYVDWDIGILYYCWDSNNHSLVADYLIKNKYIFKCLMSNRELYKEKSGFLFRKMGGN